MKVTFPVSVFLMLEVRSDKLLLHISCIYLGVIIVEGGGGGGDMKKAPILLYRFPGICCCKNGILHYWLIFNSLKDLRRLFIAKKKILIETLKKSPGSYNKFNLLFCRSIQRVFEIYKGKTSIHFLFFSWSANLSSSHST